MVSCNVRLANFEDSNAATKLMISFYKNSGMNFKSSAAWAMALFRACVNDDDKIAIIKPGGLLLGVVSSSLLGPFTQSHEIMWWVEPEKRDKDSLKMLKMYENWAKEKGASLIEVKSLEKFPETEKLYSRLNYKKAETSWIKELN